MRGYFEERKMSLQLFRIPALWLVLYVLMLVLVTSTSTSTSTSILKNRSDHSKQNGKTLKSALKALERTFPPQKKKTKKTLPRFPKSLSMVGNVFPPKVSMSLKVFKRTCCYPWAFQESLTTLLNTILSDCHNSDPEIFRFCQIAECKSIHVA